MTDLDSWLWLALGLLLAAAEALSPGIFLIWLGAAAIATGLLGFAIELPLNQEILIFCGFAVAAVFIGRKVYGSKAIASDRPLLNLRAEALVGRIVILQDAIQNGEGRARIDDSIWRVVGPDLPAGTRVKITGIAAPTLLRVEAA